MGIILLGGCSAKESEIKPENFLTLADVTGRVNLKEDSPDVRVIRIKAKSFIKQNDLRAAKARALEASSYLAVDTMVRELLPDDIYNRNFENIEKYLSTNLQKYIIKSEVNGEKKNIRW